MSKKFQIVYDFDQFNDSVIPVENELRKRGWDIVKATTRQYNKEAVKGTLACQLGPWVLKEAFIEPSFFTPHGANITKKAKPGLKFHICNYVIAQSRFFEELIKHNQQNLTEKPSIVLGGLGFPKVDNIINSKNKQDEYKQIIKQRHCLNDNPVILFAPAFKGRVQEAIGQVPGQPDKLLEIVSILPNCNVIFAPHAMCSYKNAFPEHKLRIPAKSKVEYLLGCDLLLTDTSSIGYEFGLLDKPIVLLDKPDYKGYLELFDGSGRIVDVGEIATLENLYEVVTRNLKSPGHWHEKREYWTNLVMDYSLDGNSTKRVADKIEEIISENQTTN